MRWVSKTGAVARLFRTPRRLRYHLGSFVASAEALSVYGPLYQRYHPFTMVPQASFVNNLELVNSFRNIPGCVIECGVWRGGSLAAIAEVLGPERVYHAFDSFAGLPPATDADGPAAKRWQAEGTSETFHNNCTAPQTFIEQAMRLTGGAGVQIHPGWFEATLPEFEPEQPVAVLRLDGDWYDSTLVCLRHLFPKMSPGGVIILDDYYSWDGCARATHDYLAEVKAPVRIRQWRGDVAFIVAPPNAHGAPA